MINIYQSDGKYGTHGNTYPIAKFPQFQYLERILKKRNIPPPPKSFRDIPAKLTPSQHSAWLKHKDDPLEVQQEQIIRGFTNECGPFICQYLLQHGPKKELQTAILDYSMEQWLNAVFQTLARVMPWWHFHKHNIFAAEYGAQVHNVRLMWLITCVGPRDAYQENSQLDALRQLDVVETLSTIDTSPPLIPNDRATRKFVEALKNELTASIPNGYLHMLFIPNHVRLILENFGYTSCLHLNHFFERWRGRGTELIKWIRQDVGLLCPRPRQTVIPPNLNPVSIANTANGLVAMFMRRKPHKYDCNLSLPECFDKYKVLDNYYTEEQLEVLLQYAQVTCDYMIGQLRENQTEEAVEMMLQDLACHPDLTRPLKAIKARSAYDWDTVICCVTSLLRYVELRLEFLRFGTRDGEIVEWPDLSCVSTTNEAVLEGFMEVDEEEEEVVQLPPPVVEVRQDDIDYEPNQSKSHEIAKRNAHKWVRASTFAVKEYLSTFEQLRDTALCKNCMISRRYLFPVKHLAHNTAKCTYPNVWEALRSTGLRVDFDLEFTPGAPKPTLGHMDAIRKQWLEDSREQRQAFETIAKQMPVDSCRNCLFTHRSPRNGFANLHRTERCYEIPVYDRLFACEEPTWGSNNTTNTEE